MAKTVKQITNLMLDNYKGTAPAVFSNGLTVGEEISNSMLDLMGLDHEATTKDVRVAFRQESVRNAVFSVIEEILVEGIINEQWENPFFELFVETRSQKRGDSHKFIIKSKKDLVVSRVSKDGQLSVDRQRGTDGYELSVKTETYAIAVYEYIARIMTGRSGDQWAEFVASLYVAIERHIMEKCYATFMTVCKNLPTEFIHQGSYNRKQIKEKIRNVKMASGVNSVVLMGTQVALDYLIQDANDADWVKSEKARVELMETGKVGKWHGETLLELPNAFKQGTGMKETVMPDDIIYIIPQNVEKPVKLFLEDMLIDFDNSGLRADETIEVSTRFSYGVEVITGHVFGAITDIA